jgi:hypothetical protein
MVNMHEIAVVSGFAAANRLGGKYPFEGDGECERLMKLVMLIAWWGRVQRSKEKQH